MYINIKDVANKVGISVRGVRKRIIEGKIQARKIKVNGGESYEIEIDSLPDNEQKFFLEKSEKPAKKNEIKIDTDFDIARVRDFNRKKAMKYAHILSECEGLKGKELEEWVEVWNKTKPEYETSYKSIMRMRLEIKESGKGAIVGQYGKNEGWSVVKDEWLEDFKSFYLTQNQSTLANAHLMTLANAYLKENSISASNFPSINSFKRQLEKNVSKSFIYFSRYGEAAWNRKFATFIQRDWTMVRPGQVWISDHHQIDIGSFDENGKPVFAWLTVWIDARTLKWLSWSLHKESPNSDHIFQTFYMACVEYGIPEYIYIDNGKDYRCLDFAGGRRNIAKVKVDVNEAETKSICFFLGIIVKFATPYRAQSKTIERTFKTLVSKCVKELEGYRGNSIKNRPENLQKQIKSKKLMTFEELEPLVTDYITNVYNKTASNGEILGGKSPDELFYSEEYIKRVLGEPESHKDKLKILCMRVSGEKQISRNGFCDISLGKPLYYWGEWMVNYKFDGKLYYLRRDSQNYNVAYVFESATNSFIGKAFLDERVAAITELSDNPDFEKAKLKEKISEEKRELKFHRDRSNEMKRYSGFDKMGFMKTATKMRQKPIKKQVKEVVINNSLMNDVIEYNHKKEIDVAEVFSKLNQNQPKTIKKLKMFEFEVNEAE